MLAKRVTRWPHLGLTLVFCLLAVLIGGSEPWENRAEAAPMPRAAFTFVGHVYRGNPYDTSQPVAGVTVGLWGDLDEWPESGQRDELGSTTTDASGAFTLSSDVAARYNYVHIIEVDPTGSFSTGAQVPSPGYVKNYNCLSYQTVNLEAGTTYTGLAFWDDLFVSATPTVTPRPTRTPTRTATSRVTQTATRTATLHATLTATRTATHTSTPRGSATPTRTPTRYMSPTPTRYLSPTPTRTREPGEADLEISKKVVAGLPAVPGGTLQYNIMIWQHGPSVAANVVFTDVLPSQVTVDGICAFCTVVKHGPPNDIVRCDVGDLATFPPGTFIWMQARIKDNACGTLRNRVEVSSDTPDLDLSNNTFTLDTEMRPCPEPPISVIKTLMDPVSGVAAVGDVARFHIHVENPGSAPVSGFHLEDRHSVAEFDFVGASPPPDLNLTNSSDRVLVWENLSLSPGGSFTVFVDLRPKLPGTAATNCACYVTPLTGGNITGILGPPSCATVRIEPVEGKHFTIDKHFTNPSNHVAQLGDWVSFETMMLMTGTEAASQVQLFDQLQPPSVGPAPFFPLQFGWNWPFATGDWAKNTSAFKTQNSASPAINTAEWTVTWPDGTKQTKIAQDYVYIVKGEQGKALFISKQLIDPIGGAVISDTVTFRITLTNVTGIDLPSLPLVDTFDPQCFTFDGASLPPSSVSNGQVTWDDTGPLPMGAVRVVDVSLHANTTCLAAHNCASSGYSLPDGLPQVVVDCASVPIDGPKPRLVIHKTRLSPSPVHVGDVVEWEVRVENVGNAALASVPLHDGYQSAYFDFLNATIPPTSIDPVHGRLDWATLGPLAPGASQTIILALRAIAPGQNVLNCAETLYTIGSTPLHPYSCAAVDILAPEPAIAVDKVRLYPQPSLPVAVGSTVAYSVTVRNVGPVPLSNVVVFDDYDPGCLSFMGSSAVTQVVGPGQLRWEIPSLAVGEARGWEVSFSVQNVCSPTHNCALADGQGPQGQPVHAETCLELDAEPPEPGIRMHKRLIGPPRLPVPGDILEFELVLENVGNNPLNHVYVGDYFDRDCVEYVNALPAPDYLDLIHGEVWWSSGLSPLLPGHSRVITLFLRAKASCWPGENCARALDEDAIGQGRVEDWDCIPVHVGGGEGNRLYLPLIMKWQEWS